MTENAAEFAQPDDERPVDDLDVPDEEAPADGPPDPYAEGGYETPATEEAPEPESEEEDAPGWDEEE